MIICEPHRPIYGAINWQDNWQEGHPRNERGEIGIPCAFPRKSLEYSLVSLTELRDHQGATRTIYIERRCLRGAINWRGNWPEVQDWIDRVSVCLPSTYKLAQILGRIIASNYTPETRIQEQSTKTVQFYWNNNIKNTKHTNWRADLNWKFQMDWTAI